MKKSKSVAKDHIQTLYKPDIDPIETIVNQSIMFNFAADEFLGERNNNFGFV